MKILYVSNKGAYLEVKMQCEKCLSRDILKLFKDSNFLETSLTDFQCKFCSHQSNIDGNQIKREVKKQEEKMKLPAMETMEIKPMEYEFEILDVVERRQDWKGKELVYADFILKVGDLKKMDDTDLTIKLGFNAYLSKKSGLGRFYEAITGKAVKAGKDYDLEKLIGMKFLATTYNDDSGYAKIVKDSIHAV